jgi:competence protein ComEA
VGKHCPPGLRALSGTSGNRAHGHISRRSFDTVLAQTGHSFAGRLDDVLDSLPPARRRLLAGALILGLVLLLGGRHLLHAGAPAQATPAAAAVPIGAEQGGPELVVHVVGAVHRPGLYRLRHGSRVADAVARAGGPTRRADVSLVNLAAPLADGIQVVVPVKAAAGQPSAGTTTEGPVHLNIATLEQLDTLPGVGPVTARKILDYRQKNGAFSSLDELDAIPGIGPARIEQLRDAAAP